jgi:hypothetical protein
MALCLPVAAHASTWLAAVDQYAQPTNPTAGAFMQLFEKGASWDHAAKGVQVFKASTQFLRHASEGELSAVVQGLRARRIALGMEALMLVGSERCGRGVEGYDGPGAIDAVVDRVKHIGGTISFVAMDEPLWYGSHATGPRTCHDSVEAVAEHIAPNVRSLKIAFPSIEFGDTEPLDQQTPGWIDTVLQFARAFRAETGESIGFVHVDIDWRQDWKPSLSQWRTKLHESGIRLGVIFNGDPNDGSDEAWTGHALARYRSAMESANTRPDDAVFQSWMTLPTRLLPDDEAGTLTNLVILSQK